MNRIEEIQSRVTGQSKSVLGYTADLMEWSLQKNLGLAKNVVDFTISQVRIPVQAESLPEYGKKVKDAYGDLGQALKAHGAGYVAKIREVPAEVVDLFKNATATDTKQAKTAKAAKAA